MTSTTAPFKSVYGPVDSWRYGRSLGIDPIGPVSTCSFDCVYCQLGEIESHTCDRQIFIPTSQILQDLQPFAPWEVDVITLSGSGEPSLALNLGEIVRSIKELTHRPTGVLTNGSLLNDAMVQAELAIADQVAVKIDAVSIEQFQRINRPACATNLPLILNSMELFRQKYGGHLAIQTMLLSPWSDRDQATYITLMKELRPDEIQLNTPTRPRPLTHQLDARGNAIAKDTSSSLRWLRPVSNRALQEFGDRIHQATGIPVRCPKVTLT